MKENITLNEINNKISFFWLKRILILLFRLIGIMLECFNKNIFVFKKNNKFESFFFGYHDKKPFNNDDTKIIFHSYKNLKSLKDQSKKKVSINLIDLKKDKMFILDNTKAWSWQIGASLLWHPHKDIVFFNKKLNKKYITRQIDLNSNKIKDLNFSIYNISPKGDKFLIADFIKIGMFRKGYGFEKKKSPKIFSYKKKRSKLEIIISKRNKRKTLHIFDETKKKDVLGSYINHQTFSPNGKKIAYFYTLLKKNNQRQIYFYYFCLTKKKNYLFNISKSKLISHYCWRNNDEILITMKEDKKKYFYIIYNTKTKKIKSLNSKLNKDGHPMFNPKNKDLFVSDTYPNLFGFQKLFIFSLSKNKVIWKRFIYSPYKFSGILRCDLHPRWSNDGKKIFVDFVENANRNIGIFETQV